ENRRPHGLYRRGDLQVVLDDIFGCYGGEDALGDVTCWESEQRQPCGRQRFRRAVGFRRIAPGDQVWGSTAWPPRTHQAKFGVLLPTVVVDPGPYAKFIWNAKVAPTTNGLFVAAQ